MSEWVLVPKEMVQKTVLYGDWEEPPLSVGLVIPQIPADVFAAMVERAYRAGGFADRREAEAVVRAALGISDE